MAPYRTRLVDWRPDAVSALTLYVILLFCLPARLVVPALGAAGRPADLFGLVLMCWWILYGLVPGGFPRKASPLAIALWVRLAVILLSFVFGMNRDLLPGEALAADRFLIATLAFMGVALVAADGIRTRDQLDRLLQRMTYAGGFVALVALFQFNFNWDATRLFEIPGLDYNTDQYGIQQRWAFRRVAGTANHAIEFAVITGMMLPLAIHYAFHAEKGRVQQRKWMLVGLIATGVPFSVSRAGVLAVTVALATLAMAWPTRQRVNGIIVSLLGACAIFVAVPGIVGTMIDLFQRSGKDTSIKARTDDYPIVYEYIRERPWFGRGPGTWIVDQYFTLDNEILGTLVQTGYIGLITTLAVWIVGFALPRDVRHRATDEVTKHLAQALAAVVVVSLVTTVTFDSFAFPIHTGFLMLALGAGSALWTMDRRDRQRSDQRVGSIPEVGQPTGDLVA
ncbi:MAG: O-antigen ligase family protein [Acidimicrobiia bacterium]|nr:O-antigen ligase family protein [Acidimicrobiia bacterium]